MNNAVKLIILHTMFLFVLVRQFADICIFSMAQYKCTVAEIESEYVTLFIYFFFFNRALLVRTCPVGKVYYDNN